MWLFYFKKNIDIVLFFIKKLRIMLKNLLLFLVLCFFTFQLKAQISCATDDAILREDIIKNRPFWNEKSRSGAVQFVPIKFHIVGKTDGTGAMNASEILEIGRAHV